MASSDASSRRGATQPPLVRAVLNGYRLPLDGVHGPAHWLRVLANGRALAAMTPDADVEVVGLFALLHDSRRVNEHTDPQHGERAADFVRQLASQGLLPIKDVRITVLAAACARHALGEVTDHPTIGCCWPLPSRRPAGRPGRAASSAGRAGSRAGCRPGSRRAGR